MRRFRLIIAVLILCPLFILTACSSAEEADVSDQTFLTPPEQEGELTGIWNAQKDELTIDRYFYGDGKLVTIVSDPEEEYNCILATWSQEGEEIKISPLEEYRYDDNSGVWQKEDIKSSVTHAQKTGEDSFVSEEVLPDGTTQNFDFKRGLADISVPASTDLLGYVNAFLGH